MIKQWNTLLSGDVEHSVLVASVNPELHYARTGIRHRLRILRRFAAFIDPSPLAYLAAYRDFSTTRRYLHPQAAIDRARRGHRIGNTESETVESAKPSTVKSQNNFSGINGRGERIRTSGLLVPNQARYQASLRPDGALTTS